MTKESKSFFQKYWQAIVIAVSINAVVGIMANVSAYKIILYKVDQNLTKNENQDQSIFELQMNQQTIATIEEIDLPYKLTVTRGGS